MRRRISNKKMILLPLLVSFLAISTRYAQLASAATVPPLTAKAGRTYSQRYGGTSFEGTWYLDCNVIGRPTTAMLFVNIDSDTFDTYGVQLTVDWGDYTSILNKKYNYISTGIRHSIPLQHTYYYNGEFDVQFLAELTTEDGSWPDGRRVRSDPWKLYIDRTGCNNDYDGDHYIQLSSTSASAASSLMTAKGGVAGMVGAALLVGTLIASYLV